MQIADLCKQDGSKSMVKTSSGAINAQWIGSGNNWYYVDTDGKMVTGDYVIDGKVNHFDANGVWQG